MTLSVQPEWCKKLTLQQQSVLFLAARGPDGVEKFHPVKAIQRAYRATVFLAAKHGMRLLEFGEKGDTFMCLERFAKPGLWEEDVSNFLNHIDSLPHHFIMHICHGAQILGYKHPDPRFRVGWIYLYFEIVRNFHMNPESQEQMDARLNDEPVHTSNI